jgi:hypothetical protein
MKLRNVPFASTWNEEVEFLFHGSESEIYVAVSELLELYAYRLCGQIASPMSSFTDRLCVIVVRVPDYRSRGPGSVTRFSEK